MDSQFSLKIYPGRNSVETSNAWRVSPFPPPPLFNIFILIHCSLVSYYTPIIHFFHRFPRLWNSLPPINLSSSITSLKRYIKSVFINKFHDVFLILMIHTHYTLSVLVLSVHVFLFVLLFLPLNLFSFSSGCLDLFRPFHQDYFSFVLLTFPFLPTFGNPVIIIIIMWELLIILTITHTIKLYLLVLFTIMMQFVFMQVWLTYND